MAPKMKRTQSEAAASEKAPAPVVKPMGGMEETTWSGLPMWRCPRCRGTTFKPDEAKVHTCKEVKFADEADV